MKKSEKAFILFLLLIPSSTIFFYWGIDHYLDAPKYKEKYRTIMSDISNIENRTMLRDVYFSEKLSYEELVYWENERLTFVNASIKFNRTNNQFNILENGIGRCGEFAIVYAALCFAHGYDCKIITASVNGDHVWNEVKINDTWVHVDPSPTPRIDEPSSYLKNSYVRVLAFNKDGGVENLTLKYNPRFFHVFGLLLLGFTVTIFTYFVGVDARACV